MSEIPSDEFTCALDAPRDSWAQRLSDLLESVGRDARNPKDWISLSTKAVELGRPADAAVILRLVVSRWPGNAEAWADLGEILAENPPEPLTVERAGEAIEVLEMALELGASLEPSHLSRLNRHLGYLKTDHFAEYSEALHYYNRAVELDPTSARNYAHRGYLEAFYLRNYNAALDDYNRAIELDHSLTNTFGNRGSLRTNQFGDHQGALEDYNRAIEINPDNVYALHCRSFLKTDKLGDHQGALEDYDRAINLDPGNSSAFNSRGFLKIDHFGDHTGALDDYNRAIASNPNNSLAYLNRGNLRTAHFSDHAGALEDYNRAIAIDPNYSLAFNGRGNLKTGHFGDHAGALEDYNRAIATDPNCSFAFNGRGNLKTGHFGDHAGALEDYNRAIATDPNNSVAYHNRGLLKTDHFGDHGGALEDYNRAIQIDSNNSVAYNNRGNLKTNHFGDHFAALEDYDHAIDTDPSNSVAYNNRGHLKIEFLADPNGALRDYDLAVATNPKNALAFSNRGNCLHSEFSRLEEANRDIRYALQLDPDLPIAWFALAKLINASPHFAISPESTSRCVRRGLLLDSKTFTDPLPSRHVMGWLATESLPLYALGWTANHTISLDPGARGLPEWIRLVGDNTPAASRALSLLGTLPNHQKLDRIYVLHLFGDPIGAHTESIALWETAPSDPAFAALAHFLALEVLEVGLAEQILYACLPNCHQIAQTQSADPFRSFSAALLLLHNQELDVAFACLDHCATSNMAYPALWLKWHIRHLQTSASHGQNGAACAGERALASQLITEENRRCNAGENTFTIPLDVELIQSPEGRPDLAALRNLMIQEFVIQPVIEFLEHYDDQLDIASTIDQLSNLRKSRSSMRPIHAKQISALRHDPAISPLLERFPKDTGSKLAIAIAAEAANANLVSAEALYQRIAMVQIFRNDSRFNANDNDVITLIVYLIAKHAFDRRKTSAKLTILTMPGIAMALLALNPLITSILGGLAVLADYLISQKSFPPFTGFQQSFAMLLSQPETVSRIEWIADQFSRVDESESE